MRYSNKELVIIGVLAEAEKETVSLDEIVELARPHLDPAKEQKFFRSGVLSCIRNLRLKLPKEGLELTPNEQIGRGNKAEFTVRGDYSKFVNERLLERA